MKTLIAAYSQNRSGKEIAKCACNVLDSLIESVKACLLLLLNMSLEISFYKIVYNNFIKLCVSCEGSRDGNGAELLGRSEFTEIGLGNSSDHLLQKGRKMANCIIQIKEEYLPPLQIAIGLCRRAK